MNATPSHLPPRPNPKKKKGARIPTNVLKKCVDIGACLHILMHHYVEEKENDIL